MTNHRANPEAAVREALKDPRIINNDRTKGLSAVAADVEELSGKAEQQRQCTASMVEYLKLGEEIRRQHLEGTFAAMKSQALSVPSGGSDESQANARDVGHFWRRALYFGVIRPARGEWEGPARLRGNMIDELDESAVLTTRDIEKLLKIPRQTQMDLRARGGFIPHFFVGHRVFYRKEAVLQWIAEQEAKAVGADG
jgi:Helix-turn-helix domain